MKKLLIIFSIIISGFYLTQAINLNLSFGDVLSSYSWQEVANITDKINLDSSDININGKLVSSGKICAGNSCLGECQEGYTWDNASSSCLVLDGTTQVKAGVNCKTILDVNPSSINGTYWIDPNGGGTTDAFQAYCDMTTDGGGWTRWYKTSNTIANSSDIDNCVNNLYYFDSG